jgi:YgiT-type zinc finger domain-containing protein
MRINLEDRAKRANMSFWENETCEYCGGPIVEKRVTLHHRVKGSYVQIENVPAGVCRECGTRYYAANVLKTIQESIRGRRKADREVCMPVYSL